jgi:hypothetical protein
LLRNAADTTTPAATPSLTDRDDTGNGHHQLSPGGILLTGDGPESNGGASCAGGTSPSFGFNNGSSMDYLRVGNG